MTPDDVATADRVMRRAFGAYLGLERPNETCGAVSYTATRYAISPDRSFVAVRDGEVTGSVHATRWGRFGFFGPLTAREDAWDHGVARRLLEPVVESFALMREASRVVAGVDTARRGAYRHLLARGYHIGVQGVRMHRPDGPGYARSDAFVIDDLR